MFCYFISFWFGSNLGFNKYNTFYGDIRTHFLLPNQRIEMKIFEYIERHNVTLQLTGLVKKNDSFMLIPTANPNVFEPYFDSSLGAILDSWKCKISKFEYGKGKLRIYLKIAFFKERMIELVSTV